MKRVVCGIFVAFFLYDDGLVSVHGTSKFGECGRGHPSDRRLPPPSSNPSTSFPRLDPKLKVIHLDSNGTLHAAHTVFVMEDGTAYSCGSNDVGACGIGACFVDNVHIPVKMKLPPGVRVKEAHCGAYHTLLLTEEGRVYACGLNKEGSLGFDTSKIPYSAPTPTLLEIPGLKPEEVIVHISCGISRTILCTSRGRVFLFGRERTLEVVKEIDYGLHTIVKTTCGSMQYSLITQQGELITIGYRTSPVLHKMTNGVRFTDVGACYPPQEITLFATDDPSTIYSTKFLSSSYQFCCIIGGDRVIPFQPKSVKKDGNLVKMELPILCPVPGFNHLNMLKYQEGTWQVSTSMNLSFLLWKRCTGNKVDLKLSVALLESSLRLSDISIITLS